NQNLVTVVAGVAATNVFSNSEFDIIYSDEFVHPFGWGGMDQNVNSFMSDDAVWGLRLDTNDVIHQPINFIGYASALESFSQTSWDEQLGKTAYAISFNLSIYPTPEPGTFALLGTGALALAA